VGRLHSLASPLNVDVIIELGVMCSDVSGSCVKPPPQKKGKTKKIVERTWLVVLWIRHHMLRGGDIYIYMYICIHIYTYILYIHIGHG